MECLISCVSLFPSLSPPSLLSPLSPSLPPPLAEIPLFHVVSARVTFGNLNACDTPAPHVKNVSIDGVSSTTTNTDTPLSSRPQSGIRKRHGNSTMATTEGLCEVPVPSSDVSGSTQQCIINDSCFSVPEDYRRVVSYAGQQPAYNEEELLQMAIEQSLLEQGPLEVGGWGCIDRMGVVVL